MCTLIALISELTSITVPGWLVKRLNMIIDYIHVCQLFYIVYILVILVYNSGSIDICSKLSLVN